MKHAKLVLFLLAITVLSACASTGGKHSSAAFHKVGRSQIVWDR